jgi:hypothetical protein
MRRIIPYVVLNVFNISKVQHHLIRVMYQTKCCVCFYTGINSLETAVMVPIEKTEEKRGELCSNLRYNDTD